MLVICVIVRFITDFSIKPSSLLTFFLPVRDSKFVMWSEPWVLWSVAPLKTGVITFLKDIISIFLRIDLHLIHQEHIRKRQNTAYSMFTSEVLLLQYCTGYDFHIAWCFHGCIFSCRWNWSTDIKCESFWRRACLSGCLENTEEESQSILGSTYVI